MMKESEDEYFRLYDELVEVSKEIKQWYDTDKIKSYSVYIWTKGEYGENVFDVQVDEIVMYNKEHKIIEEAMPTIKKIQSKLKEMEEYVDNNTVK